MALGRMRDAQVRRVPVVNDMCRLVAAISIDDLVLVGQNVRAGADAASIVAFHAVGRVELAETRPRQPVQVSQRGRSAGLWRPWSPAGCGVRGSTRYSRCRRVPPGVDSSGFLAVCPAGPARRRLREIHDYPGSGRLKGPSSFIPTFGGVTGTDPRYGNRSRKRTSWHSPR